ncbi:MAG TPA: hypothetical protein PK674_00080 [Candidatus Absconditabacterales bacterium]|nr:hypothetical protein [Candidatus Absconditabacterales bacterium]HOQ78660.1 hypothetical protein [Candidatus Absconditabacterales bacterium]HPK27779.1 hypothetical protein [Candidatus Absconditabacterales bacterium]
MKRQKIFILVGWLHIEKDVVFEVFNEEFENCRCRFISNYHYLQKKFDYWNFHNEKIAAIFVGPVPHKTAAAGDCNSMASELIIANSPTPVFVCKNKARILKFTKTSLRKAISEYKKYSKLKKIAKPRRKVNLTESPGFIQDFFYLFHITYWLFLDFVKSN